MSGQTGSLFFFFNGWTSVLCEILPMVAVIPNRLYKMRFQFSEKAQCFGENIHDAALLEERILNKIRILGPAQVTE